MDWKQELLKRLDTFADKLGTTGAHLWEVLVRQGTIAGASEFLFVLMLVGLAITAFKWSNRVFKHASEMNQPDCSDPYWHRHPDPDTWRIGAGALRGLSIVLLISATFTTYDALTTLLNPEFYALTKILETLK